MFPKRRGSAASVATASVCEEHEAESETATVNGSSGRKRRKSKEDSTNIEDIANDCEEDQLQRIVNYLRGKADEQTLVLYMIRHGKLKKKQKVVDSEPLAAASTNKFNLLSIDNWAEIISMVDGVHFEKEILLRLPKAELCKLGCMIGGIDPRSALISRRLRLIASFIKKRSTDLYKDQYSKIKLVYNEQDDEMEPIDFSAVGVFEAKIAKDKKSGKIVHKGSGKECPMPPEMISTDGTIYDNHSETTAYFKGAFSDPLISRVFSKAGETLPKLFWIKKITDFVDPTLTAESLSKVGETEEDLEEAANAALAQEAVTPPKPPPGTGGSKKPPA